jgi:hypothetical protein
MSWAKEMFKKPPAKPKGWLSVNDIVKESGNARGTVGPRLREMVKKGLLDVMECFEDGKIAKCYKPKK